MSRLLLGSLTLLVIFLAPLSVSAQGRANRIWPAGVPVNFYYQYQNRSYHHRSTELGDYLEGAAAYRRAAAQAELYRAQAYRQYVEAEKERYLLEMYVEEQRAQRRAAAERRRREEFERIQARRERALERIERVEETRPRRARAMLAELKAGFFAWPEALRASEVRELTQQVEERLLDGSIAYRSPDEDHRSTSAIVEELKQSLVENRMEAPLSQRQDAFEVLLMVDCLFAENSEHRAFAVAKRTSR